MKTTADGSSSLTLAKTVKAIEAPEEAARRASDPQHDPMIPHPLVLEPDLRVYRIYSG